MKTKAEYPEERKCGRTIFEIDDEIAWDLAKVTRSTIYKWKMKMGLNGYYIKIVQLYFWYIYNTFFRICSSRKLD